MLIWNALKPNEISRRRLGLCPKGAALGIFVFFTVSFALFIATQPAQAHDVISPAAIDATTAPDGLLRDEERCGGGFRIPGTELCTHGPDTSSPDTPGEDPDQPLAPPPIVCTGDGVDGKRVQVMYVRTTLTADRYEASLNAIRAWAAGVDGIFDRSAHATGGHRHIRFVTTADCNIDVLNVVLPPLTDATFTTMIVALRMLGYDSPDRKYLMFVDTNVYCGIGTAIGDDTPGADNRNNERTGYARVDVSCWGSDTAAHELTHTLGGVQHSAPHASGGWHCTDEFDLMCYSDAPYYPAMAYPCQLSHGPLLDCNNDDYFHTNPSPDNYLSAHWNVANSVFLTTEEPANSPPRIGLTTPGNVRAFVAPARVPLAAETSDEDGSVAKVEFRQNTTVLATVTSPPFVFTWEGVAAGVYTLTATAYDDRGGSTDAAPLSIEVVTPPNLPPAVTLAAPANVEWTAPATIPLTATAADPDGAIAKVEFYSGASLLHSDNVAPYTMTWHIATSGAYTVTARVYDNEGASTTSAPLAVMVVEQNHAPPVVQLSLVTHAAISAAPVTATLSAEVITTNAGIVRVDFYQGETLLGSDFDMPYTLLWQPEASGTYTLTAQAYDTRGASAISLPLTVEVPASEAPPVDQRQDEGGTAPNAVYLPVVVRSETE